MAPNVLDGLQDTDSRKLAGVVVAFGVKAFDEVGDSRKLLTVSAPVKFQ